MKHDELFEVLDPPPHGLTRLRAGMREQKARGVMWPVSIAALAVVLLFVLWPRPERVDFSNQVAALTEMTGDSVMARGDTGVEPMRSTNPKVVIVRTTMLQR